MRGALQFGFGLHRVAVLALALVVLAFALQPCFATVALAHPCCPKPVPACHQNTHPEACTMGHTGFGSPEESSGPNDIQAEVIPATVFELSAPASVAVACPVRALSPVAPFLLNSVFLI